MREFGVDIIFDYIRDNEFFPAGNNDIQVLRLVEAGYVLLE